jgi:Family of unknown function (DUF6153)
MRLMSKDAARRIGDMRRQLGRVGPALLVLVVSLLIGLRCMNALDGHADPSGHQGTIGVAAAQVLCQPGDGLRTEPRDDDHCCHARLACKSGAIAVGPLVTPPALPPADWAPVQVTMLTATAADDAAAGTGRGPPSLDMLSISRT